MKFTAGFTQVYRSFPEQQHFSQKKKKKGDSHFLPLPATPVYRVSMVWYDMICTALLYTSSFCWFFWWRCDTGGALEVFDYYSSHVLPLPALYFVHNKLQQLGVDPYPNRPDQERQQSVGRESSTGQSRSGMIVTQEGRVASPLGTSDLSTPLSVGMTQKSVEGLVRTAFTHDRFSSAKQQLYKPECQDVSYSNWWYREFLYITSCVCSKYLWNIVLHTRKSKTAASYVNTMYYTTHRLNSSSNCPRGQTDQTYGLADHLCAHMTAAVHAQRDTQVCVARVCICITASRK